MKNNNRNFWELCYGILLTSSRSVYLKIKPRDNNKLTIQQINKTIKQLYKTIAIKRTINNSNSLSHRK